MIECVFYDYVHTLARATAPVNVTLAMSIETNIFT